MVAAFSLAMLLNRTLVMPKFVCFCDRYWCAVLFSDLPQTSDQSDPFAYFPPRIL